MHAARYFSQRLFEYTKDFQATQVSRLPSNFENARAAQGQHMHAGSIGALTETTFEHESGER